MKPVQEVWPFRNNKGATTTMMTRAKDTKKTDKINKNRIKNESMNIWIRLSRIIRRRRGRRKRRRRRRRRRKGIYIIECIKLQLSYTTAITSLGFSCFGSFACVTLVGSNPDRLSVSFPPKRWEKSWPVDPGHLFHTGYYTIQLNIGIVISH